MYNDDRKEKINKEIIDTIRKRSLIENYIRFLLVNEGYTEVKTPIINRYADIAPITQFKVESPLETTELYLRIAPTEQLKKLLFYGFDKIFEFSTNFRDDSIDNSHLSEFTSIEIMEKNTDVYNKMDQTEKIIKKCMNYCIDEKICSDFNGVFDSISKKWPRIDIIEYILNNYNIDVTTDFYESDLETLYNKLRVPQKDILDKNMLISYIVGLISKENSTPVFIGNYPWDVEGPAKESNNLKGKERYELYYKNLEIANMSSTLTNYKQLIKWYYDTINKKNLKENRNYSLDPELLYIFEKKIPESAVVGIGIDRLIMLLLNKEIISDVVCFDNKVKRKIKLRKD